QEETAQLLTSCPNHWLPSEISGACVSREVRCAGKDVNLSNADLVPDRRSKNRVRLSLGPRRDEEEGRIGSEQLGFLRNEMRDKRGSALSGGHEEDRDRCCRLEAQIPTNLEVETLGSQCPHI